MKFFGKVGYGISEEVRPGVWKDRITEREYAGDLVRDTSRRLESASQLNDNITISNAISIVGDPFAYENFSAMRYVEYLGTKWKISTVEIQYPRLVLTTGGIYNGEG